MTDQPNRPTTTGDDIGLIQLSAVLATIGGLILIAALVVFTPAATWGWPIVAIIGIIAALILGINIAARGRS